MIRIKSAAVMLIAILLAGPPGPALAVAMTAPDDVRASLKDARAFQVRASVSAIPTAVRASFSKARDNEPFAMAEPSAE